MSPIRSSIKLATPVRSLYRARKCRASHIRSSTVATASPRCSISHSRYSLHTSWQRIWPGSDAIGSGGHCFCTSRNNARTDDLGLDCHWDEVNGRDVDETIGLRNADNLTHPWASLPRRQSSADPGSKESYQHCGSSY